MVQLSPKIEINLLYRNDYWVFEISTRDVKLVTSIAKNQHPLSKEINEQSK